MPSTSNDTALAAITQWRASRRIVSIHERSICRDVIDRDTNVTNALTAQYVATVAVTTHACHTHSKVLGIATSQLNTRPEARVAITASLVTSARGSDRYLGLRVATPSAATR